jgi:hypothetical protein
MVATHYGWYRGVWCSTGAGERLSFHPIQGIRMKKHLIGLAVAIAAINFIGTASAQTVRRCIGPEGKPYFTDAACPDASSGAVVRQESPEARAARQQSEAANYELAQQRAQESAQHQLDAEARRDALLAERDAAIDDGISAARRQAADNQAADEYRTTRSMLQSIADGGSKYSAREKREAQAALMDLAQMRTAQASGDPGAVQRAAAQRDVRQAQAEVEDARREAQRARNEAQRVQQEARQSKYDANTGRWCESPAPGITNCHP